MRGIIVCLLIWLSAVSAFGQPAVEWTRTFAVHQNQEWFSAAVQTADGGFAFAGHSGLDSLYSGYGGFWLVRTNSAGDTLWTRYFQRNGYDACMSLVETFDGGFALAGWSSTTPQQIDGLFWLIKTDAGGDSLWSRTYGRNLVSMCYALRQTRDHGYVLAGLTGTVDSGNVDFLVVRTDSTGDSLWTRQYGGADWDGCSAVLEQDSAGFVLAGTTYSYGSGFSDFWLLKISESGAIQSSHTYGGAGFDWCSAIVHGTDGGFVLAGTTVPTGADRDDFWLVKTNRNGEQEWARSFGGSEGDACNSLTQTPDGSLLLAGYTNSFVSGINARCVWLVKASSSGDSLWSETFNGGDYQIDNCTSVLRASDGGYVLAGARRQSTAFSHGYVIRTEPEIIDAASDRTEPRDAGLLTVYPNPFNLSTTIEFSLSQPMPVSISVCDLLGRKTVISARRFYSAGPHTVSWTCPDCSSGLYFLSLDGDGVHRIQKAMLLK